MSARESEREREIGENTRHWERAEKNLRASLLHLYVCFRGWPQLGTAQHATAQHGFNCAKEMPDARRDGAMVMAKAMAMANGANKQQ